MSNHEFSLLTHPLIIFIVSTQTFTYPLELSSDNASKILNVAQNGNYEKARAAIFNNIVRALWVSNIDTSNGVLFMFPKVNQQSAQPTNTQIMAIQDKLRARL